MEAENRSMHMQLQHMSKRQFGLTFVVFLGLFIICIIVGATGPTARKQFAFNAWGCPPGFTQYDIAECTGVNMAKNFTWRGEITSLDLLNQNLRLRAVIHNLNPDQAVDTQVVVGVGLGSRKDSSSTWSPIVINTHTRTVKCPAGRPTCDSLLLGQVVAISDSDYRFNVTFINNDLKSTKYDFIGDVTFTFDYENASYTQFEVWFRFVFFVASSVALLYFAVKLRKYAWRIWTLEQQWVCGLLFGLIAYNNPFFPINILVGGSFWAFLDQLFTASFVAMLLFFWIIMYDGIRLDGQEKKFVQFYLPKIVVVGLFWIFGVVVYAWFELHQIVDPVWSTDIHDNAGFVFCSVILGIIVVSYVFYVLWVIGRAYRYARTLPLVGFRLKALGVFTIVVIIIVAVGLVFNFVGAEKNSGQFLTYVGLFNLYIYLLTYVYLPPHNATFHMNMNQDNIGMVRLEDETPSGANTPNKVFANKERPTPRDPNDDEMDTIYLDEVVKKNEF